MNQKREFLITTGKQCIHPLFFAVMLWITTIQRA